MKDRLKDRLPRITISTLLTFLFTVSSFAGMTVAHAHSHAQKTSLDTRDYTRLVDPFTGTGTQSGAVYGGGDTFPGPDVPFGMVQWSPDTGNNTPGGYDYNDNRIKGFSLTHLNGAGCNAYGDIPFMPYVGSVTDSPASNPSKYISNYAHSDESAYAGYYKVKLANGATTELTATQRSGAGRFTYPSGQTATMLVNISGSVNGNSDAQASISGNTISGSATSGSFCGASDRYTVYFWASFSQPFSSYGTWQNGTVNANSQKVRGKSTVSAAVKTAETARAKVVKGENVTPQIRKAAAARPDATVSGTGSGVYGTFDTNQNKTISVRVGLSYVSVDNAKANVDQENASGNFDTVLSQATSTWNNALGQIQTGGGTSAQTATFYSSLYHVLLQPNVVSDVNGQYFGFDRNVHTSQSGHAQYGNFSGWDIYRSEAQLLGLLAPAQASDIAQSMVNDYTQGGALPKWTTVTGETYVMVGDPADPIIADIYAFGGRNFDTQAALNAMVKQASQPNNSRPGLNYLEDRGYLPEGGSYGCCNLYGVSATTLEYNTADFAVGIFAKALGDTSNYHTFVNRAQNWQLLLNPNDKSLEPRKLDGSFDLPYDPKSQHSWVESNGEQYNWLVPFNLKDLFASEGGNSAAVSRLNTFFTKLNAGPDQPYAFLGNEPTLETPWEYDYAGAPYKTQDIVHRTEAAIYGTGPGGLAGNDDLGETSSWYVFAAMGMYPETPGTADMALASPIFSSITITRPGANPIQINAPGASSSNYYVQSLKVNGNDSTKPWLPADFILNGGTVDYTLASTANTSWGTSAADAPPSYGRSGSVNNTFSSGFESTDVQPSLTNTIDYSAGYPAGGLKNITGACCGLTSAEAAIRSEIAHNGSNALMYSGSATNGSDANYAYSEIFDLSDQNVRVGGGTTLSYWIYPESPQGTAPGANLTAGKNSTCVSIDLIFGDGTNLRDIAGAVDQNGHRIHPAYQCTQLTLDSWNHVTVNLGSVANGKKIVRIDQGYDQANVVGGYRGYIDEINIS